MCIVCGVQCVYGVCCVMCIASVLCSVYSVCCVMCIASLLYSVYSVHCVAYSVLYIVYIWQCEVSNGQRTVCSINRIMCSVQSTYLHLKS